MDATPGARSFLISAEVYDHFMGRYSEGLAPAFVDAAGVVSGSDVAVLDVGCGPGALTGVLVDRHGRAAVSACDPSPPFVEACAARFPQVTVRHGRAEALPFDDRTFDVVLAQLVMHFVSNPAAAAVEMRRVARLGGVIGACVWDFDELWTGFLGGVGPAGSYCVALDDRRRGLLRNEMFRSLGSPSGSFSLSGTARCAVAHTPL